MTTVKPDNDKMKNLLSNAKSIRKFDEKNLGTVGRALFDYALEQDKSYYLRRLSVNDIKKLKASDLIESFRNAMQYEIDIFYTGQYDFDFVSDCLSLLKDQNKK